MLSFLYNVFVAPIELIIEMFFAFLMKPLDSVGLSIVGVSAFVSLLTLPLYHIADQLQKTERDQRLALKPGIDRIKAVFKGDEQYMILNTFYKQNNYHPIYALRNSLSLLIQIPFFIAAYQFLSHLNLLKGQGFLFINDLGANDAFATIGPITINILPILMTVINIGSAIIYTKGFPIRDKVQTFTIPLIFLALLYNSPAGLVFYWTLNNIFSLLKNIVYKMRKPILLLYLAAIFVSVVFVTLVFKIKVNMSLSQKLAFIGGVVFVISIPLLIKLIDVFIKKYLLTLSNNENRGFLVFLFSSLLIVLLNGIVIPANLISSSPIEFSFIGNSESPLSYILYTFSLFLGLALFWPLVIYSVSDKKIRSLITFITPLIALTATINAFIFGGDYGDISNLMIFEDSSRLITNNLQLYLPILLTAIIFVVLTTLVKRKYTNIVVTTLLILVITSTASGSIGIGKIAKSFKDHKVNISKYDSAPDDGYTKINPLLPLSRTEKNVVVVFLDRAVSSYLPIVFEHFPNLKESYRGFVYYPNTLSFGAYTVSGGPPLMGGYEYTPEEMNKRDNERLVDKHNESSKVLPKIFSDAGYKSTIFNPLFPNYKWSGDFSPFKSLTNLKIYETRGQFTLLYKQEHKDDFSHKPPDYNLLIERQLPMYSILKTIFPLARQFFYDEGNYFLIKENSGSLDMFIDSYSELHYLPELTKIEDGEGSYIFFVNDTTHEPELLQAPKYIPTDNVTDKSNPLEGMEGYGLDEQRHYHINAATLLKLADWIEFLKENGVYDNTRIIIVSDHGRHLLTPPFSSFENSRNLVAGYNPLLVVKDFNSREEFSTDYTLMTNADVPFIATEGIVDNLINPYTNENMKEWINKSEMKLFWVPWHPNKNKGNTFSYDPKLSFTVIGDIFEEKNWIPFEK